MCQAANMCGIQAYCRLFLRVARGSREIIVVVGERATHLGMDCQDPPHYRHRLPRPRTTRNCGKGRRDMSAHKPSHHHNGRRQRPSKQVINTNVNNFPTDYPPADMYRGRHQGLWGLTLFTPSARQSLPSASFKVSPGTSCKSSIAFASHTAQSCRSDGPTSRLFRNSQ